MWEKESMSGDDLRVTTAHLVELTVQQVRAAARPDPATFAAEGVDAAVRSTHGDHCFGDRRCRPRVLEARRGAGVKVAAISDDLGGKLAEAARRYDEMDDAMGRALDGQVQLR